MLDLVEIPLAADFRKAEDEPQVTGDFKPKSEVFEKEIESTLSLDFESKYLRRSVRWISTLIYRIK